MRILLTNDDGIYATGLRAVYDAMREAGHNVFVVAPMTDQSGVGHSITIHGPLRVKEVAEHNFSGMGVFGSPTDCVKLAVSELLPEPPDIIVSGINAGSNVGSDILHSGTVAAATEAAHLGFPALALSYNSFSTVNIEEHAAFAVKIMEQLPWQTLPKRRVINVNLPSCPMEKCKGLVLCPQTSAVWNDWYDAHKDSQGNAYWWLDGQIHPEHVEQDSDKDMVTKGYATLTPLRFDFTDRETMTTLTDIIGSIVTRK